MKKKILFSLLIVMIFLTITGCSTKAFTGLYVLDSIKGDNASYTADEYKNLTTIQHEMNVKDDKNLTITMKYINSTTNKEEKKVLEYTYDKEFIYDLNGKKVYSYKEEDRKVILNLLEDTHNTVYTYKKK